MLAVSAYLILGHIFHLLVLALNTEKIKIRRLTALTPFQKGNEILTVTLSSDIMLSYCIMFFFFNWGQQDYILAWSVYTKHDSAP